MADDYSSYDLSADDPYLLPRSTCLQNHLGLTDTATLNEAEEEYSRVRLAGLASHPVPPTFDLTHLQAIHKRLFGDVYPFAGAIRTVEIGKGGKLFLPYTLIPDEANRCFSALHNTNLLAGLTLEAFGSEAGFFLGWINKIHPFREGNGRTQRVLIDQLAEQNGYAIEWTAMSNNAMALACRAARETVPNHEPIRRLVALNTVPLEPKGLSPKIRTE